MTREQLLQQQASARIYQERYDTALSPWGFRADAPTLGQDIEEYRRDNLVRIKKLLPDGHEYRGYPIRKRAPDALEVVEPQILGAVSKSAFHPTSVPQGTIELRHSTDSNGHHVINPIGQESFVKQMMPPVRRVVNIFTGTQVYDAFRARWR
jgi:hypothetical protein